ERHIQLIPGLNFSNRSLDISKQSCRFFKQYFIPIHLCSSTIQSLSLRWTGRNDLQLQTILELLILAIRLNVVKFAFPQAKQSEIAFHHIAVQKYGNLHIFERRLI